MDSNIIITNSSADTVHISIEGVIGQKENPTTSGVSSYEGFKQQIEAIASIDSQHIVVDIRSTGGSVNDALLIHDAILATEATVTTRCFGYVASAATIIAQAASRGNRQISANALYLIHNSVSEAEGNAQSLVQTAELLDKTDQTIAGIYAAGSSHSIDEFIALMSENNGSGRWLTPAQALELELVDSIIEQNSLVESVVDYSKKGISALWNRLVKALGVEQAQVENSEQGDKNGAVQKESSSAEQITLEEDESGAEADLEVISAEEYELLRQEGLSGQEVDPLEQAAPTVELGEQELEEQLEEEIVVPIFRTDEALEERLEARASRTMDAEDPAMDETKPAGNRAAYYEDVKNF